MSVSAMRAAELVNAVVRAAVIAGVLGGALLLRSTVWGSSFQATTIELDALSPLQLSARAADSLTAALGPDGTGLTFEVVQRSTLVAKPGGPRIELRDPDDRTKVVAVFDERQIAVLTSHGSVTADAFWMDISVVPPSPEGVVDVATAELFARVVETGGVIWRNDGWGWYVTDGSPGVGMDPASARLLPQLLRGMSAASSLGLSELDGRTVAATRGESRPADYPGVIAADGAPFTEPTFTVDTFVDEQGRLAKLVATARNLNQETYDLVIETTITFSYGASGSPPELTPTLAPESDQAAKAATAEVQR